MKYLNQIAARLPSLRAMSGINLVVDRNGLGFAIIDNDSNAHKTPRFKTARELYQVIDGGLWLADSICPRPWVVTTSTGRKLYFAATGGHMAENFARPSLLTGESIVGASPVYFKNGDQVVAL
jgi:hypothetical protein